jgi:hypothetical protein
LCFYGIAAASSSQAPTFTTEIAPLLGKYGCSDIACHGALKGKGQFRLSLHNRRVNDDYQATLNHVDKTDPAISLLLRKAVAAVDHGGGQLLDSKSLEYQIILDWISSPLKKS